MQEDLNGQEKKVIAQYINDTFSKYQLFQKQKLQQSRHYQQKITTLNNQLAKEKQKSQLLEQQLNEMRDRYNYLKRQQDIFSLIRSDERPDNSAHQRIKNNEISSIMEIDQQKIKEIEIQKNKIKRLYEESQSHCHRLKQQNEHCQKQITILTDYINEKEMKHLERIKVLEQQLSKSHTSRSQGIDHESVKTLQKQKRQLQINLQKCTEIVRQSEEFYMLEIQKLENKLKETQKRKKQQYTSDMQKQVSSLQESLKLALKGKVEVDKSNARLLKQIQQLKINIEEDLTEISKKREEEKQEFIFSQNLLIQTFEKKFQIAQDQAKRRFEEYQDKISFLIIKLEQSNHPVSQFKKQPSSRWRFNQGMNLHDLSVCESQSMSYRNQESLHFDSASVSRSIKQNLSKAAKKMPTQTGKDIYDVTPVKNSSSNYALSSRTNLMQYK